MALPTFEEVLHHSIRSPKLIRQFNDECACSVVFDQLPDLVNNHQELKGKDRIEIDLLILYLLNFVYLHILYTNNFKQSGPLMRIQNDDYDKPY